MNRIAQPPNMLPTSVLTNKNDTSAAPAAQTGPSTKRGIQARSDAPRNALIVAGLAGLAGLGSILLVSL